MHESEHVTACDCSHCLSDTGEHDMACPLFVWSNVASTCETGNQNLAGPGSSISTTQSQGGIVNPDVLHPLGCGSPAFRCRPLIVKR
jgi:hypothetical protein